MAIHHSSGRPPLCSLRGLLAMVAGRNRGALSSLYRTLSARVLPRHNRGKAIRSVWAEPRHTEVSAALRVSLGVYRPAAPGRESCSPPLRQDRYGRRRIALGLASTGRFRIGSPKSRVSSDPDWSTGDTSRWETRRLTGMPELVLMPAPVTTTTFFALYSEFAISCSSRAESGVT